MRSKRMCLVFLLTGCGLAPLSSEEVFRLSSAPHGWLVGTITNQQTGAPLRDAVVSLEASSARSDAAGQYRLDRITAQPLSGSVVREGFGPRSFQLDVKPGANRLDVALSPLACGGCATGQVCDPSVQRCVEAARLSGDVVDACTGAALDAKVSVGGKSACTSSAKGLFQLQGLLPGGPQTLAIGKQGYVVHTAVLTLVPGFNTFDDVRLERIGGCSVTPATAACECLEHPACD